MPEPCSCLECDLTQVIRSVSVAAAIVIFLKENFMAPWRDAQVMIKKVIQAILGT